MTSIVIIQNLKCRGCAKTIVSKLSELEGITNVNVNEETSSVSFDSANAKGIRMTKSKLKSIGYPSVEEANTVFSKAKSFVSCASGKLSKC